MIFSNILPRLKSILPVLEWLPKYSPKTIRWDLVAGLTLALFIMPESLAYAALAGVPPQYGVYCCLVGGLIFALFTSTRQVAVGPTSAISLMIGSTAALLSEGDPQRWIAIAGLTALAVGFLCLLAYFFKLNSVVNFISESILMGFKAGAALTIASTQLPKLFGVEGASGNFFNRMEHLISELPQAHWPTLCFGLIAFAVLFVCTKVLPGRPVSLFVLIFAILLMTYTSLSETGIKLTGHIPSGLPSFGKPSLRLRDVDGIMGLAFACFLMGYIETVSAGRTLARKNNYKIDTRQELLSMGMANIATAFASGYAVSGGLSQSTVNDKTGAKSPLALVFSSITLSVLLFFTGLLTNLPEVVLAAIVLDAILGLIKYKELKHLYKISKLEFSVSMVALCGVLTFGILKGVLLAVFISIALHLRRVSQPQVSLLGRIKGSKAYTELSRYPEIETFAGLMILRVEASLVYINVEYIKERVLQLVDQSNSPLHLVILRMASSPYADVAGCQLLLDLNSELKKRNIKFRIVETDTQMSDLLRLQGIEKIIGPISPEITCNDLVEQYLKERSI